MTTVEVTPYVGVWIETLFGCVPQLGYMSLLMWECGLKHTVELARDYYKE